MIKKGAKIATFATVLVGGLGIYLMYKVTEMLVDYIKDEV